MLIAIPVMVVAAAAIAVMACRAERKVQGLLDIFHAREDL